MMTYARSLTVIAALFGALGVMLGAFAAHGANNPQAASWLQTGGPYLLVHGIAALVAVRLAQNPAGRVAATLFLLRSAIFAGTLTALRCDGPRWLGAERGRGPGGDREGQSGLT